METAKIQAYLGQRKSGLKFKRDPLCSILLLEKN